MGTGAMGGTMAMRLNDEPKIEKIIRADYDLKTGPKIKKTTR